VSLESEHPRARLRFTTERKRSDLRARFRVPSGALLLVLFAPTVAHAQARYNPATASRETRNPTGAPPKPVPPPDTTLKPYGFIRLDSIYDSAAFNHPQAPFFVQRQPPGFDSGGEYSLHPRLSRVGVDIAHRPTDDVTLNGKIEIDFQIGRAHV
jgi:hypothetical protein